MKHIPLPLLVALFYVFTVFIDSPRWVEALALAALILSANVSLTPEGWEERIESIKRNLKQHKDSLIDEASKDKEGK